MTSQSQNIYNGYEQYHNLLTNPNYYGDLEGYFDRVDVLLAASGVSQADRDFIASMKTNSSFFNSISGPITSSAVAQALVDTSVAISFQTLDQLQKVHKAFGQAINVHVVNGSTVVQGMIELGAQANDHSNPILAGQIKALAISSTAFAVSFAVMEVSYLDLAK